MIIESYVRDLINLPSLDLEDQIKTCFDKVCLKAAIIGYRWMSEGDHRVRTLVMLTPVSYCLPYPLNPELSEVVFKIKAVFVLTYVMEARVGELVYIENIKGDCEILSIQDRVFTLPKFDQDERKCIWLREI